MTSTHLSRRGFLGALATTAVIGGRLREPLTGAPWTGLPDDARFPLCVFSKHLQWLPYPEMAEFAAEIGFDGIDLTVRPGGHVLPERVQQDLPAAVKAVRNAGLEVEMITTAVTDAEEPSTRSILETAVDLGIRRYRSGYYFYDDSRDPAAQLQTIAVRMRKLTELNRELGIWGGYQNHAGLRYFGAPLWDLYQVLKDLDPGAIGCQYDIRHATLESGSAWPLGLRLIAPYTRLFAVKDFYWERTADGWRAANCPPGEGMVDFQAFAGLLREVGASGPVSVHFEYPLGGADRGAFELSIPPQQIREAMKRDLDFLRRAAQPEGDDTRIG